MWPPSTLAGWIYVPAVGILLAAFGFCSLTGRFWKVGQPDAVRSDIYVARLAYWFAAVGLLIVASWAVSAIVVRSLAVLKALGIIA